MNGAAPPTVVILGAGVNGCSVARDLVLNGVSVWMVDAQDVAFGATSRSSRLIHGGLRYLEYGDFRLVRESLAERTRLCKLAPHLVEPLRLYIPVARRSGGLLQSARRFLGVARSAVLERFTRALARPAERGLWTVEIGLSLYDRFAADPAAPPHSVHELTEPGLPQVNRGHYRWLCGYSDAQMRFPERYCVALLDDTRQIARDSRVEFRLFTYAHAELRDRSVQVTTAGGEGFACAPALVVNATGAWGDFTLRELGVPAPQLFGGTKGSHFVTHQPRLKRAIGRSGVYAEAADGRLIFVLPFGDDAVLVGTTDERFDDPPETAVATRDELAYLISTVNQLFPDAGIAPGDVTLTYSGVRPLPRAAAGPEGSISRDHSIDVRSHRGMTVLTLVGGKLTTARAFGELAADSVLKRLGMVRSALTSSRVVPGGKRIPADRAARERIWDELASRFRLQPEQVGAMWSLCGDQVEEILRAQQTADADPIATRSVAGTRLPRTFVRRVIAGEWVSRLEDLVERRLMLLYEPGLSRQTLAELAGLLVEARLLNDRDAPAAVESAAGRLETFYGRRLTA